MERETYNTRLRSNPEDIPVGSLLRVKKHCRNNDHYPQQRRVWYFGTKCSTENILHTMFISQRNPMYLYALELGGC